MIKTKKLFFLIFLILIVSLQISLASEIVVKVDGQEVDFDVPPAIREGWVFVPLRGVFEKMGAVVHYDSSDKTVLVQKQKTVIHLKSGSNRAYVNDNSIFLFIPPYEFKGRTMVPLRFITEALGCQVLWQPYSKTVLIDTKVSTTPQLPSGD